jgi:hypothetical protein
MKIFYKSTLLIFLQNVDTSNGMNIMDPWNYNPTFKPFKETD